MKTSDNETSVPASRRSLERRVGPLETVAFRCDGREFEVTIGEDGALRIYVTGKRNGKMLLTPESNNSITIQTEKAGMPERPNAEFSHGEKPV